MKRFLALITPIFFATSLIAIGVVVHAQSTEANQDAAAQRCERAQYYIKSNIQPRDLRTRVDRLQTYQYIYQRLDTFVKRLEHNQQPLTSELRAQLNTIRQSTDSFKTNYETYDNARDQVTKLSNCKENITEFQNRLADARMKRQKVNEDVVTLQKDFSTTKTQLESLYDQLLASDKSGSN